MNKKRLLILTVILFNLFLIVPKSLAIEVWVDGGTYVIERQINLGTDDVFAVEDYYLWTNYELIPVKYTWGDMRIGLRFNNVTIGNSTATYRERIVGATLSFYTNSSMPLADERVMATIYAIDEENPSTFTTYENFMDRPIINYFKSIDFKEVTSSTGEWFNYTGFEHIVRTQIMGLNNNVAETSIAFKIYSASGEPNRYFRTYEYDPNYSVKLYIEVQKLNLVDSTEEGWFYDEYRGIDIWLEEGKQYEDFNTWVEFDRRNDLTIVGDNGSTIMFEDYGYETWSDMRDRGEEGQFSKALNDTYSSFEVRFRFTISDTDTSGHRPDFGWFGINGSIVSGEDVHAVHAYNSGTNIYSTAINVHDDSFDIKEDEVGWCKFVYDGDDAFIWVWIQNYEPLNNFTEAEDYYNTLDVDDLTFSSIYVMQNHESGMGYGGWNDGYITDMQIWLGGEGFLLDDLYYAVDCSDNGTCIKISPYFDTPQEVKDWIDDYLFRTGEDDKLDMWGDTILALMGLSGFIMIPLSFYLFMANMSTDLDNAFYLLMVVFIMGLAFVITWLWA